ncbi:MAG: permease-like cell division protein FtsX [Defluviitaleaceae bacterium]|nr:permease-like cell division protein FtsX [Defluviitaleaceae bacterium]
MKLRNLKYFLSESIKSLIRNRLMSLASIITVASCTLIFAISYFIVTNVNQVLTGVERSMNIVVFLEIGVSEEEIEEIREKLLALPYVMGVSFTSSEEAFENVIEDWGMDYELLIGMTGDILPNSFSVEINALENQIIVASEIVDIKNVDRVIHDEEAMDLFLDIRNYVTIFSLIIIGFLASISTVIIINTIKITVSARKNEINIMKYVGATDWFIRWPFLMEGILIGVLGAGLTLLVSYFMYTYLINSLMNVDNLFLNFIINVIFFEPISTMDVFIVLTPVLIIMGVIIGFIGSITSVRKYLRV